MIIPVQIIERQLWAVLQQHLQRSRALNLFFAVLSQRNRESMANKDMLVASGQPYNCLIRSQLCQRRNVPAHCRLRCPSLCSGSAKLDRNVSVKRNNSMLRYRIQGNPFTDVSCRMRNQSRKMEGAKKRASLVVVDPEAQVDVLVAGHRRQCGDFVKLVHHSVLPPDQHPVRLRPHRSICMLFRGTGVLQGARSSRHPLGRAFCRLVVLRNVRMCRYS